MVIVSNGYKKMVMEKIEPVAANSLSRSLRKTTMKRAINAALGEVVLDSIICQGVVVVRMQRPNDPSTI